MTIAGCTPRRPIIGTSFIAVLALAASVTRVAAQTLRGLVQDATTREPIELARVLMLTESADTIASSITNDDGRFSVRSPEPGSFLLFVTALGYRDTPAGIFDLGADGEMTLEFRMTPVPMPIDALLVQLNHPAVEHRLVRNGFVRRYQLGHGHFLTPRDLERSPAIETEGLFAGVPGVVVRPSDAFHSHLDDVVEMRGPGGGPCRPSILVDGRPADYDLESGSSLSSTVPLSNIAAVEIYRSPAEIPIEFDVTRGRGSDLCGVVVFWTWHGR